MMSSMTRVVHGREILDRVILAVLVDVMNGL
jgi:hypothetical protein